LLRSRRTPTRSPALTVRRLAAAPRRVMSISLYPGRSSLAKLGHSSGASGARTQNSG
jgi:hypothetical protein